MACHSETLRVLVLGGSQGARALNSAVPQAIADLRRQHAVEVRHQCGEALLAEATRAYEAAGVPASVEAFIQDMATAYAWADLVIARAGASTISELCAVGVGAILVPFPNAVDDHQARNAEFFKEAGAGDWLRQSDALAAGLLERLRPLAGNRERLLAMAQAARAAALPRAAETVADIVMAEARA